MAGAPWSVRDLTVRFGDLTALDGVGLDIEPGRIHGVVGGDGAGKSTLLKVLAGLDVDRSGSVDLPDRDRVAYVPTDGGIFADLTVDENMEFVASVYGLGTWRDRARELLTRAGIARFGDRIAGRMSGGERRKLATSMALLPELELLVLDEISTGVDPLSRQELWRLVAGAVADGAAVVTATTYLDEAERMDPVLLLHRGRTLGVGSPDELAAMVPGAMVDRDLPDDPARAWRSGRRWRQWQPHGVRHLSESLSLEEVAVVLELAGGDSGSTTIPRLAAGSVPVAAGNPAKKPRVEFSAESAAVEDRHPPPRPGVGSGAGEADRTLLEADDVTRRFGAFLAVDNVSLAVRPGEIVGLLGANGAGKTTLMRMLLGLLDPTAGRVSVFGGPHTRELRRRIGYVPQSLGLYADLTGVENLRFRARVYGVAAGPPSLHGSRGRDAGAERCLIADHAVGDQRAIAFEAATGHDPDLLVLDEPTSGVSSLARSRLWDMVHRRADGGVGVLVSTHHMDEATQADRLVIMAKGRVVATGTAEDIVGERTVTEVISTRWADAFTVLDRSRFDLRLAGTRIRVPARPEEVAVVLADGGIHTGHPDGQHGGEVRLRTVPATLEEVLIELDRADGDRTWFAPQP